MFGVPRLDGKPGPGLQTTICPIRQADGDTEAFVGWFLEAVEIEPLSGVARGVREWPMPGGIRDQLAVWVEAVGLALVAFNDLLERNRKRAKETPAPVNEPKRRRRK